MKTGDKAPSAQEWYILFISVAGGKMNLVESWAWSAVSFSQSLCEGDNIVKEKFCQNLRKEVVLFSVLNFLNLPCPISGDNHEE